ncbi:hypothetical protein VIGAN_01137900 [Vigna angularis var. angularis]|uniref:Uncharacterized protein n=1 Tax=Vigna angularis var. angularis TaxID=157739 RepID=A0A0S3QZS4_PHAAN|nr:hypothetical protein VIGAN_01137900 [Vigna angularis var. angularis]
MDLHGSNHMAENPSKCVDCGVILTRLVRVRFVSGPRELLLKFVEENYPLLKKLELLQGEDGVKELQRKRYSATLGVSVKGRVRKVVKWQPPPISSFETTDI